MTTTRERTHSPANGFREPYLSPATLRRQADLLAAAERMGVHVDRTPAGNWRFSSPSGLYILATDPSVVSMSDLTLDHPTAHPEARAAGHLHAS